MNLKRTTIIPLDDAALAESIFKSFIEKEMMIIMVIIGDTETVRDAITKADNLALLSYFKMERWVLWIRNYNTLSDTFKVHLKASDAEHSDEEYDNIKCFCFSPILDQIDGIILKNGQLSYASLQQSFFRAQSHDIPFVTS
ncbi:hypothetical protein [Winogradskyella bathintestinalis]|uniref:Uncharacterized protein n=1 Tax=Winogradskyella bathintestinalis TaxID=3035208 RepID=A0ABT7ZX11_9FLAO|nr:hypothetical protein [Winogradskyella bathintestinalis]MDN3493547.1 hypothetical protein [Winogradskyella bathintestinalis]